MLPLTAVGIEDPCHLAINCPSAEARVGTTYIFAHTRIQLEEQ